jgi:hypothetical protein
MHFNSSFTSNCSDSLSDAAQNNQYPAIKGNVFLSGGESEENVKLCLLGYNVVNSLEIQKMFRRSISPPSLRQKNKSSKKPE